MRKITEQAIDAFYNEKDFKKDNTSVISWGDLSYLMLHGHKIASLDRQGLFITTAGWNTNTTRDRLNGLPGVCVRSRKGQLTLNGYPWNGDWVNVEDFNLKNKNHD